MNASGPQGSSPLSHCLSRQPQTPEDQLGVRVVQAIADGRLMDAATLVDNGMVAGHLITWKPNALEQLGALITGMLGEADTKAREGSQTPSRTVAASVATLLRDFEAEGLPRPEAFALAREDFVRVVCPTGGPS